jgi:transcriptional repressor NF-X1
VPAAKRTFVISLCQVYRLSTDLLDAEPNRSIMIRRKIDTRIPTPLLTAAVPQPYSSGVEKKTTGLTNLRASTPSAAAAGSSGATWGKIAAPTPTTSSSAWRGGSGSGLLSGTSTPGSVYHTPMSSRAISPAVPESSGSATMTVPVNQTQTQTQVSGLGLGLASKQSSRQGVVGEVGKVEEDDWDVDA